MDIKNLIGNTPMIKMVIKYKEKIVNVFAKLEYYNYTGSIKDRMAYYIINESYKDGTLKRNMPIIEATSGNTGISLSAIGAKLNHPVYIFMPDWVSTERIKLMEIYGAKVKLISKESGGFRKCIKLADELAEIKKGYRPNQFTNYLNTECHYKYTANEILKDLKHTKIGGFISGIGSGGTLMGISKRLKEVHPNIQIGAVEPSKMPLLTKGIVIENHKIEGIGDDFIPALVDTKIIDKVFDIDDEDAINMARLINKKIGLGVGISSGANFLGAILLNEYTKDPVITIFPDDNKKYLSTDLTNKINLKKELLSNKIKLLDYTTIKE